jgi:hypothetical protein
LKEVPAVLEHPGTRPIRRCLMDEVSVTRTVPTLVIVADEAFCAQAAAVLMCDEEPIRNAFIGEPVEEVLAMVRWALSHEDDEGFDTAKVLTDWAEKRERGAWSTRLKPSPTRQNLNGKLAEALATYWSENPHELAAILDQVEASLNGRSRDD